MLVKPYEDRFVPVTISESKVEQITKLAENIVRFKQQKKGFDNNNLFKRFYNGLLGEAAIEKLINRSFINWTVGNSSYYNIADLSPIGLDMGVKSVEYGKFPVIHKRPKRPEIINLIKSYNEVLVCGVATIYTMKSFQNDDYILSWKLRKKGTKTGFYGFIQLIQFNNYISLENAFYADMFMQRIAM